MNFFKRTILYILVFNFIYAPVVPNAFAQQAGNGENSRQPNPNYEIQTEQTSAQQDAELKKGSIVEIEYDSSKSEGVTPQSKITIIPGTDPKHVYKEGSPQNMRSKIGTVWHYMALRNADTDFVNFNGNGSLRDKREKVTAKDIKHGGIHFFNENLSFNLALFSIKLVHLIKNEGASPVAFQDLYESLKDPIGYVSFYAFMAVNGYAADFLHDIALNKGKGVMLKRAFTSIIPYLSMTAGSMASHITGDMLRLFQACSQSISERGKTGNMMAMSFDPCEEAWKEWTVYKKFHIYGPSLIAMLSATWASGMATMGFKRAYYGALNYADKITEVLPEESFTRQSIVKLRLAGTRYSPLAIKSGASRWALTVLGKTPNFILFLGLTELFEPFTNYHFENLTRGGYVPVMTTAKSLANKLMRIVYGEKKGNWNENKIHPQYCNPHPVRKVFHNLFWASSLYNLANSAIDYFKKETPSQPCYNDDGDIVTWISEFSEFMQGWRDFNQSQVTMAHQSWISKINNLKNSERLSYYFYEKFVNDQRSLWLAEQAKEKIKAIKNKNKKIADKDIDSTLFRLARYKSFVMRDYPLFGVKSKLKDNELASYYFNNPEALELSQIEVLRETAKKYQERMKGARELDNNDHKFLNQLFSNLNTTNKIEAARELSKIKSIMDGFKVKNLLVSLSNDGIKYLELFYREIGSPRPQFSTGAGFANIFNDNAHLMVLDATSKATVNDYLEPVRLDYTFGPYRSNLKVDYLAYQMLCGIDTNYMDQKHTTESGAVKQWFGFSDEFIAPRLIRSDVSPDLCDYSDKFRSSDQMYTDRIQDKNSKFFENGIFNFIIPNLRTDIKQIVNSEIKEGNSDIAFWWNDKITPSMVQQFQKYQEQYEQIAVSLVNTLNASNAVTNKGIIHNSIIYSSMQEMRIYSMIIAEILRDKIRVKEVPGSIPALKYVSEDKILNVTAEDDKNQKLKNWNPVIAESDEALFANQVLPYNGEMFLMLDKYEAAKRKPVIFEFQYQIEQLIAHYYSILSKIKIEKKYNKEYAILNVTEDEIKAYDKRRESVEKTLKAISIHLGGKDEKAEKADKNKTIEQILTEQSTENLSPQQLAQRRVLGIFEVVKNKIMEISGQADSIFAQLKVMKYNKNGAVTKEECRTTHVGGRSSTKVGNCK